MMGESAELLRRLGAGDESAARTVMALSADRHDPSAAAVTALSPMVKRLVRLAALVAGDAPINSLYWAVEQACCAGASDDEIVNVLAIVGREVGVPQLVSAAPRLALAIGYDVETDETDLEPVTPRIHGPRPGSDHATG
jgi:4-carboxymuconolactone decarboxylase